MKLSIHTVALGTALFAGLFAGCQTTPNTPEKRDALVSEVDTTWKTLNLEDPSLTKFIDKSYGHVIFPSVGKGGLIAGGAYGRGVVYEQGVMIGYADLSQATIGLQAGGQSFTELVAFETKLDLDRFKTGKTAFSANVSAVALKSGAAESAKYTDGVAVFVKPIGGLMFEASVGGQQFTFSPK